MYFIIENTFKIPNVYALLLLKSLVFRPRKLEENKKKIGITMQKNSGLI